uniref:Uncharacterized protein n=1 Tax=Arundo donax TaxID=35708 RepID=A0A0A9CE60_ARUDO
MFCEYLSDATLCLFGVWDFTCMNLSKRSAQI